MDAPCAGEHCRGFRHRIERGRPAERRLERFGEVEGERTVAVLPAARNQRLGPAGEFRLATPQPFGIEGA